MGWLLVAKCKFCGLSKKVSFGSENHTMGEKIWMPAIDIMNTSVVEINYYEHINDKYFLPYATKDNKIPKHKGILYTWEDYNLTEKYNFCPKCRTHNLEFLEEGRFN